MNVNIENEYDGNTENFLSAAKIKEIAEAVVSESAAYEKCPFDVSVDLLITDDESIMEMNSEQRDIDKSTDVLSFPAVDFKIPSDFDGLSNMPWLFDLKTGELFLGDIVISADHCMAHAKEYGHPLTREFAFLIAHSMLHLMGYDHMEDDEREDMERRQEEILTKLNYVR